MPADSTSTNGNGNRLEKLASNATLTLAGRFAMLLAVPLIGIVWKTIDDRQRDLNIIQLEMTKLLTSIQIEVGVLKVTVEAGTTDRYRGTDAIRDGRVMQVQLDNVKLLNENLSRRIEVLERQVPGSATRGR